MHECIPPLLLTAFIFYYVTGWIYTTYVAEKALGKSEGDVLVITVFLWPLVLISRCLDDSKNHK